MKFSVLILLMLVGFISCKKDNNSVSQIDNDIEQFDSIPLKKTRLKIDPLKPEISKKLSVNPNYNLLKENIELLNRDNYGGMKKTLVSINEYIDELNATFPEELKKNSVLSRLNELKTYSLQLEYLLSKNKNDTVKFESTTKKILVAYNRFTEQLNDITFRLSEEVEKEFQERKNIKKDTTQIGVPLF